MSSEYENNLRVRDTERIRSTPEAWGEGIAIIGMSARFPQSRNAQEFWDHLVAGDILLTSIEEQKLRDAGVEDAKLNDPNYVRRGNTLEDAENFDANFFGLSSREAEILDPQQRVFLECAWEALEDAGHTGDGEQVGVFAGAGMNTYVLRLLADPSILANAGGYQLMLASDKDFLSTRVAYKLNLRGPAVTVQTACSTSLAAVHLACSSLLKRECSMAIAGGVSIPFPQNTGYSYIPGMILSADGYCRPFDIHSGGTVPGRGAGAVVLKRLSDAIVDRDSIIAVIRGSAWNNDGATKVGYTAPSVDGQADVIRSSLAAAGVDSTRVGYVETHGTATELGDAIEIAALAQIFGARQRNNPLRLGAVKANIGHADAAAGIAGLIKAALAVKHGLIPSTPTFTRPNPVLGLENTPFEISSSSIDWGGDSERWAGISSFGIGGTNVHVTMSSAPTTYARLQSGSTKPRIFPVSAKTSAALNSACEQLSKYLGTAQSISAAEVSTTLQRGRRAFNFRRAVVASSCGDASNLLNERPKKRIFEGNLENDVVFLFPGQGQQFPGMVGGLYGEDRAFRQMIDEGCDLLREQGIDLGPFLVEKLDAVEAADRLRDTEIAQPALVLVECALAERLRSIGIVPSILVGHSLGEISAAYISGVFSFRDAIALSAQRGRLMGQTPAGRMLAVMLPPEGLMARLVEGTWIAAENGPKVSIASGRVEAIEELERRMASERVATVRLASKNAFHTPLMADAAKVFRRAVAAVELQEPKIPWLSNVTGTWITKAEAMDPNYWANQILSRVRFSHCIDALGQEPRLMIEVGPGETLIGLARQRLSKSLFVPSLGSEERHISDVEAFHRIVATSWESGLSVRWNELDQEETPRRIALPTYPFERKRHSTEPPVAHTDASTPIQPLSRFSDSDLSAKRGDISKWFYAPSWRSTPPASIVLPTQNGGLECWIVIGGGDQLTDAMISALQKQGHNVFSVRKGEQFVLHGDGAVVSPSSRTDFELMWHGLNDFGLRPSAVICLPELNDESGSRLELITAILQAAGPLLRHLRRFEFVTASTESVAGESVADSEDGELTGLASAIEAELSGAECRCIDVDFPVDDIGGMVQHLLDELSTVGSSLRVAYRRGMRWQKEWVPAPLKASAASPFRRGGTYLITGGVGGIGSVLARHLLLSHDARVVVVGRTALPDRTEWASWIAARGEGDRVSRQIRRMQDLEKTGGRVLFMSADVADMGAMASVFEKTQAEFGPINGVIHAAGIVGASRIVSQSTEDARAILRAKVTGSRVLAGLLMGNSIDFLLLCSSFSAYLPAPGESAYAAANSFENSFAEHCRRSLKIPAIAIGFDAWREVGMNADIEIPEGLESYYDKRMSRAMTNDEGIEVVRRVLGGWSGAQILTSTVDLASYASSTSVEAMTSPRGNVNPLNHDELTVIVDIWRDLLGVEAVDPSDNFFNLGGHSLMGTMMIARIREQLGVTISLRDIFEGQTPERLAEVVCQARRQALPDSASTIPMATEEREIFEI
ncbi:MAG: SDR family NAD(P)-dependent oxidoreductase [Acidobacteria bacterium]|nr:SDR family NAD(P)-dependent oxidoreductase [Acidobacteriota bacterium]